MARIRSLKPEAFQSETLSLVSLAAERTFFGMSTIADDRGRLADKPAQINGDLWSMRGNHGATDLEQELAEMAALSEPLVCRYVGCNGKRYLHLVTWDSHQKIDRASKSRQPRCPVHQTGPDDYCGLHEGACPDPSRGTREPSRGSEQFETGHGEPSAGNPAGSGTPSGTAVDAGGQEAPDLGVNQSSRDPREDSMLDLGPRTVDRGSRTVDQGAPPAGATAPPRATRRPRKPSNNTGDVIAAYVEGALDAGLERPAEELRKRVGSQAGRLIAEGKDLAKLVTAARNMGAAGWDDLARQLQRDSANANGSGRPHGHQTFRNPADQSDYDTQELRPS